MSDKYERLEAVLQFKATHGQVWEILREAYDHAIYTPGVVIGDYSTQTKDAQSFAQFYDKGDYHVRFLNCRPINIHIAALEILPPADSETETLWELRGEEKDQSWLVSFKSQKGLLEHVGIKKIRRVSV